MAYTQLRGDQMFGLNAQQQVALVNILNYLNAYVIGGGSDFPTIPYDMFVPFSQFEASDLNAALRNTWNTGLPPAGEYLYQGFNDGTAKALSDIITVTVPEIVIELPGAPTIGVATKGDKQVSVAFTAPASDGGGTITAYTATSTPGSKTATGTSSPIVVTGLTNGTAYTFKVTATNFAGTGPTSAASAAATPSV